MQTNPTRINLINTRKSRVIAINAGVSIIDIPFIGIVNIGILYPLIVIPLAVIFAANSFNLLGGFNGISTLSGFIVSMAMLIYSILYGSATGALLSGILVSILFAFSFYDGYPAKIIPGDSYTYAVGAALVITMILGSMESFGVIVFMPWIIEFILHLKGKFNVTDLGKLQNDGTFISSINPTRDIKSKATTAANRSVIGTTGRYKEKLAPKIYANMPIAKPNDMAIPIPLGSFGLVFLL